MNPNTVGAFRDLGSRYIERLGTGIRRMALAMEGHGLPRPQFEEDRTRNSTQMTQIPADERRSKKQI